jgi:hypothetical protein
MRRTVLTILTMMLVGLIAVAGCRSDDDDNSNTNHNINVTDDHTVYQVQDESDPNHLQAGDLVRIERVVVTAVDKYDSGDGRTGNVWVQEPTGGAFSGVMVFGPAILPGGDLESISVGDLVDVNGEIDEFALTEDTSGRTTTEISNGTVTVLGVADPLEPEVVTVQELTTDPSAEQWESVLVRVLNIRATDKNASYNEVTYTGGLVGDDELWDLFGATTVDTCYGQVTGVMNYFFKYFLMPRSDADLVEGVATDCATASDEICDDGIDNNGNSFIDCDDWDCQYDPACIETECDDDLDNDEDGDTDCDDSDCLGTVACPAPTENNNTDCDDGMDNDGDNLVDCEDPSCSGHPDVNVCPTETNCSDGLDDDNDGHIDCADWDCGGDATCMESDCDDNIDNDDDGHKDCADRDCWSDAVCDAVQEVGAECNDGADNDGDGYTDCADFSCKATYANCIETNCSDGLDDDNDGHIDCDDFDCIWADGVCSDTEGDAVACSDGLDNDGDGFTDCGSFSCRCCPSEGNCTGFMHVASTCSPCQ